ncbi:Protein FAM177A1 [Frankliniella fusca]|uniref:Protein FAM177A1 n=1 Tax=Frankliniella fusca TaxID=407009 RepID=A0AAE1H3J2_9NEOP|nr:Protein FAM177A1 [Frankliniella fusca]
MMETQRDSIIGVEGTRDSDLLKPLEETRNQPLKKKKVPRRILHFSDGTLEEYSTDEDEDTPDFKTDNKIAHIDPRQMTWFPWMWYQAATAASQTLQVCDYLGESLASFFGITTPKYQYEIEEYHRIVAEEKEMQRKMDMEMGGWVSSSQIETVGSQPQMSQARY